MSRLRTTHRSRWHLQDGQGACGEGDHEGEGRIEAESVEGTGGRVTCGHVAETGQVCDLERSHDGQHGCRVVAAWDDGRVTRAYLSPEDGVDPDADLRARTE